MEKRVMKILDLQSSGATAALLILSAAFLLGSAAGCLLAGQVDGGGGDALGDYLQGYLSAALSGDVEKPELFSLIWETVRWPLFVLILSLTPLGLLGIPILFLVRGFLMSFAVASFFRALGTMGLVLAFIVFGIPGLIGIPVLFVLGVQGFLSAGAMVSCFMGEGRLSPLPDRMFFLRCGLCAAALCICGLTECCVVPPLLESLAALL